MKKTLGTIFTGLLGGAIAFAAFQFINTPQGNFLETKPSAKFVSLPENNNSPLTDFTYAAENSINAVVHVRTVSNQEVYDPWAAFFGGRAQQIVPQQSSGSGVIVSDDGFIVTNNHVVDRATKIEVKLNNNEIYEAKVIGTDPATDLALLKIDGKDFPHLPYGNSDKVKVGQWVLAVGNPFNLTSTVTAGIVSAKARNINLLESNPNSQVMPIESFIQTDAAVNPGNSGGALVGPSGELLGINTAIASNTGSFAGYSFAIPVNIVKKVVNDLYEFGKVQRAFIGVGISDLNKKLVNELGLQNYSGVYISTVNEAGAAEKAGIKPADVITKIADVPVNNTTELMEQLGKYRPGDKVTVELIRNSKTLQLPLVLKNEQGNTKLNTKAEELKLDASALGAQFTLPAKEELSKLNIENGVKVQQLTGGKLKEIGMKPGFIITKIDKEKVSKPEDVNEILSRKQSSILIEGYYPNGMKAYYGFGS